MNYIRVGLFGLGAFAVVALAVGIHHHRHTPKAIPAIVLPVEKAPAKEIMREVIRAEKPVKKVFRPVRKPVQPAAPVKPHKRPVVQRRAPEAPAEAVASCNWLWRCVERDANGIVTKEPPFHGG